MEKLKITLSRKLVAAILVAIKADAKETRKLLAFHNWMKPVGKKTSIEAFCDNYKPRKEMGEYLRLERKKYRNRKSLKTLEFELTKSQIEQASKCLCWFAALSVRERNMLMEDAGELSKKVIHFDAMANELVDMQLDLSLKLIGA